MLIFKTINFVSITALFFLIISCDSYLKIDPPIDKLESTSVFSDSSSTSLALIGIYANLMSTDLGLIASQNRLSNLYSDELRYTPLSDELQQFENCNLNSGNSLLNTLWSNIYKHIYQANAFIEGVEASSLNDLAKSNFIAEAKFLRAFLFFYAINNWGDVPFTTSSDYRVNEKLQRKDVEIIIKSAISDLIDTKTSFPIQYSGTQRTKPNRYAITTLLSQYYLISGDWENVERTASEVIGSETYSLSNLEDAFKIESPETIWQLFPSTLVALYNSFDGFYFVPASLTSSSPPAYILTDNLLASFEVGDKRKSTWIGQKTANGTDYFFPYKYKIRFNANREEYTIVFRLAELYLNRAEARAHIGNLSGSLEDLDLIRERAGLSKSTALAENEILGAIAEERRHELFCEWGNRWLDLRRTSTAAQILQPVKGGNWQDTDLFWPIPLPQLSTNPNLAQNSGY